MTCFSSFFLVLDYMIYMLLNSSVLDKCDYDHLNPDTNDDVISDFNDDVISDIKDDIKND